MEEKNKKRRGSVERGSSEGFGEEICEKKKSFGEIQREERAEEIPAKQREPEERVLCFRSLEQRK